MPCDSYEWRLIRPWGRSELDMTKRLTFSRSFFLGICMAPWVKSGPSLGVYTAILITSDTLKGLLFIFFYFLIFLGLLFKIIFIGVSVQFSSFQSLSCVQLFATP